MKKLVSIATVLSMFGSVVFADSVWVTGEVVASTPISVTEIAATPSEVCEMTQVPVYRNVTTSGNTTGGDVLAGMIVGGLIGKGMSGNDRGAAVGAVLGGMASANRNQVQQQVISGYREHRVCNVVYTNERVQRVIGYETVVTLGGNSQYTFETATEYHPGRILSVQLTLN